MFRSPQFRQSQEQQCGAFVYRQLLAAGASDPVATALVPAIMATHQVSYLEGASSDPNIMGFIRHATGWAIRASDFEFVKMLLTGSVLGSVAGLAATTAVAVHQGTGLITVAPAAVAAVAGMIGGMYNVYFIAKGKGATLDPLKTAILMALRKVNGGKGATPQEVADYLAPSIVLTADEVKAELQALKEVTTDDGTKVAFAFAQDERWRTDC